MVKADVKHDYYADLDLPPTADAEEIKRQFRLLAKQFHPDRNPGREIEVVAKFQDVQAAHEILSDVQQKTKYDADRAKQNRLNNAFNLPPDNDPYNFRRPPTKPATSGSSFPPPPRRTNTTQPTATPFPGSNGQTQSGQATSGAAKFQSFTRAAPQQWDRAKFDEAARADAARGFQSMKNSQRMPPPKPPRHPTARRPFDDAPSGDERGGPQPGFPGMSRTANVRRQGFDPASPNPGMDESAAPRSAYSTYTNTHNDPRADGHSGHRMDRDTNNGPRPDPRERPPSSGQQGYFPEGITPQSPLMAKQRPAVSPLRHARSSGFDASQSSRPGLDRVSSRYAMNGGERTNVNAGGLGRSASVRTSPVDRVWDDRDGRFHTARPHSHYEPSAARHQSASPKVRPHVPKVDFSSSDSSSSGEDAGPNVANRPKAQTRPRTRPRVNNTNSENFTSSSTEDPALTGQFPSSNYTKVVDHEPTTGHYRYPPPPEGPIRRPFANMTVPDNHINSGTNGGHGNFDSESSKYDIPPSLSRAFSEPWTTAKPRRGKSGMLRYGLPRWAVPASVMPLSMSPPKRKPLDPIQEEKTTRLHNWLSSPIPSLNPDLNRRSSNADQSPNYSHRPPNEQMHSAQNANNIHSVSDENINKMFSAADWEGKFGSGDEYFRPRPTTSTESQSRERKSPSKTSRLRTRSVGKGRTNSQVQPQDTLPPVDGTNGHAGVENVVSEEENFHDAPEQPKAAAFQPAKFSAEEWAEKLKDQTWSVPSQDLNARKTPIKRGSKSNPRKPPPIKVPPEDVMDIDETMTDIPPQPRTAPVNGSNIAHQPPPAPNTGGSTAGGVSLDELKTAAPFGPANTGLKDLNDLSTTLPFESRAAQHIGLDRTKSSTARRLELPKPPKVVQSPSDSSLTQDTWQRYVQDLTTYLHDWSVFNIKMLDHFRSRQDQISVGMRQHWISAVGDGPSPDVFEAGTHDGSGHGPMAGFATYMAWLEDDAECRVWWDVANERHRACFEEVQKVREKVKRAAGV